MMDPLDHNLSYFEYCIRNYYAGPEYSHIIAICCGVYLGRYYRISLSYIVCNIRCQNSETLVTLTIFIFRMNENGIIGTK
mgnify:CR=1 FL=1